MYQIKTDRFDDAVKSADIYYNRWKSYVDGGEYVIELTIDDTRLWDDSVEAATNLCDEWNGATCEVDRRLDEITLRLKL